MACTRICSPFGKALVANSKVETVMLGDTEFILHKIRRGV